MMLHCHHYYDEDDKPAVIQHDHECTTVRHAVPIPKGLPVYWDHEGSDCDNPEGEMT